MKLAELNNGERAVITSMQGLPPHSRKKLLDMGLLRGEEVVMVHKAPLGDPLWLGVKGYELSFRRELALQIEVEKLEKPLITLAEVAERVQPPVDEGGAGA